MQYIIFLVHEQLQLFTTIYKKIQEVINKDTKMNSEKMLGPSQLG